MMFKHDRRGGKRKFRAKGIIIILLLIMVLDCFVGNKIAVADAKTQEADQAKQDASQMLESLTVTQQENDALKQRLEASAKIVTPETTKAIVREYVKKYFGDETPVALAVFTCESNLNPSALNDHNQNGSVDRGIPQINSSNRKTFERVTGESYDTFAHDIDTSIKYAKWLKDNSRGGWSNWTCYQIVNKKSI